MRKANTLRLLNTFGFFYFLLGVASTIYTGFEENYYLSHVRGIPIAEQDYPLALVMWISGFMFIHIGSLLLLTKSFHTNPYIIVSLALIINMGFLFLVLLGAMHSPPAWSIFGIWEFGLLIIVIIFAMVAGYRRL